MPDSPNSYFDSEAKAARLPGLHRHRSFLHLIDLTFTFENELLYQFYSE
jgi:hypothetical protein